MRQILPNLLLSVATLLLVFGVPEGVLRAAWTPPPPPRPAVGNRQFVEWLENLSLDDRDPVDLYRDDRDVLWSLVPGARVQSFNAHFDPEAGERQTIAISINTDGYRGPRVIRDGSSERLRILCMGDSNFFGYPLDDADAFPSALQRALAESFPDREVEVINGGVPGYTVIQGWRWFERSFADYPFDVLLLSYVNNDAWRQPRADADLIAARSSLLYVVAELANRAYIVRWARTLLPRDSLPPTKYVPRVSLELFESHYRRFLAAARKRGATTVILDHRAYEQIEPYSDVLQRLGDGDRVTWVPVANLLQTDFDDLEAATTWPERAARVHARWGERWLRTHEYLWRYAEVRPEHLNELGNAWLASRTAEELVERRSIRVR